LVETLLHVTVVTVTVTVAVAVIVAAILVVPASAAFLSARPLVLQGELQAEDALEPVFL
jgi:hypothetical protein